MISSEFGIWHCEEEDYYVCLYINPFPEDPEFPLMDKMSEDIFQPMKAAEQASEKEYETSRTLNQLVDDLAE